MNNPLSPNQIKKIENWRGPPSTSVIFTFASKKFLKNVLERIKTWEDFKLNSYFVVALNEYTFKELKKRKKHCILVPLKFDKREISKLWMLRVSTWLQLLKNGISFVHVDCDTIWKSNPINYIQKQHNIHHVDALFAPGSWFPREMYEKYNFTLRCGFFSIKSTPDTIKFVKDIKSHMQNTGNDQRSLNQLLLEKKIVWESDVPYFPYRMDRRIINVYPLVLTGKCADGLKIGLLPFFLFPRARLEPFVIDYLPKQIGKPIF